MRQFISTTSKGWFILFNGNIKNITQSKVIATAHNISEQKKDKQNIYPQNITQEMIFYLSENMIEKSLVISQLGGRPSHHIRS